MKTTTNLKAGMSGTACGLAVRVAFIMNTIDHQSVIDKDTGEVTFEGDRFPSTGTYRYRPCSSSGSVAVGFGLGRCLSRRLLGLARRTWLARPALRDWRDPDLPSARVLSRERLVWRINRQKLILGLLSLLMAVAVLGCGDGSGTGSAESWRDSDFSFPLDQQSCSGSQLVRFDESQGLWVGVVLCSSETIRIYLSGDEEGPYLPATDTAGHGQDHCELVSAAFRIEDEDDITSGGCGTCRAGPNLSIEGVPVFARAVFGEPFHFVAVSPTHSHQASRLSCGVDIGG